MVLPLMDLSHIATQKLSLTPLSSCLMSNQPQSSAKAVLLACKSVLILPCDPFSFRPVLCLTHTILCSFLSLLLFFLYQPSLPPIHNATARMIFQKKKNLPLLYQSPSNGFYHLLYKFGDSQHSVRGALWSGFSSPFRCHDCHSTFHTWIHYPTLRSTCVEMAVVF